MLDCAPLRLAIQYPILGDGSVTEPERIRQPRSPQALRRIVAARTVRKISVHRAAAIGPHRGVFGAPASPGITAQCNTVITLVSTVRPDSIRYTYDPFFKLETSIVHSRAPDDRPLICMRATCELCVLVFHPPPAWQKRKINTKSPRGHEGTTQLVRQASKSALPLRNLSCLGESFVSWCFTRRRH
jgi:hypothetical protein